LVYASIITIGDELLIGQTIDTNSAFIGQELNKIGVWVRRRIAVGDVYDDIWDALDEESEESDIIIITGGLGPTADDITKPLLCDYFGGKLVMNEQVLKHIEYLFEHVYRRPMPLLERNRKQAEVPDNCIVLMNERGTAPGMMWSPPAPRRGVLEPESSEKQAAYSRADPMIYGLLKEFVATHRKQPTDAENVMWAILRGKKMAGYKFRRQHIISTFIADFVCLAEKLIIEIDGLHHQLPENKISDDERSSLLNKFGFRVIRFSNSEVLYETDRTITKILNLLKKGKTQTEESKNPPSGGRGAGRLFFSLPGVPWEMKALLTEKVIPAIEERFDLPVIIHQNLLTAGVGESQLADKLKDWEEKLPAHMKLAYLPHYGMVRLRITSTGYDRDELEKEIEKQFAELKELVNEWLVIDEDMSLQQAVAKLLKERRQTVGTAESCTGGYIAHLLSRDPGASSNYKGSVISYDNKVKTGVLGVSQETIDTKGAVCEDTVRQMAKGGLDQLGSDYIIVTSGIMGPDGGSEHKPIGMVWIAVGNKERIEAKEFHFRFDRSRNIEQTAIAALNMLRKFIIENA
jgi:PncC family amidohydrolase